MFNTLAVFGSSHRSKTELTRTKKLLNWGEKKRGLPLNRSDSDESVLQMKSPLKKSLLILSKPVFWVLVKWYMSGASCNAASLKTSVFLVVKLDVCKQKVGSVFFFFCTFRCYALSARWARSLPQCLLMWAQSLLHSQNLTRFDGSFFFRWILDFFFSHTMPVLICPFGIKSVLFHPCVMCLFSFAVRFFFFFGMGIW